MAQIIGTDGHNTLTGTAGNDFIDGRGASDSLFGLAGDDELWGGGGGDRLEGAAGTDFLRGDDGPDAVFGGDGRDRLYGGGGTDTIDGGAGDDWLLGADYYRAYDDVTDSLRGGPGTDVLDGWGAGMDRMFGEEGNDYLFVDGDEADGGPGDDFLGVDENSGGGRMTGGPGADDFNFFTAEDDDAAVGIVTDFTAGQDVLAFAHGSEEEDGTVGINGPALFAELDQNGDHVLSSDDGSHQLGPEHGGVTIGVDWSQGALLIDVGDDQAMLRGINHLDQGDWFV